MLQPAAASMTNGSAASAGRITSLAEEDLGLAVERFGDRLQLRGGLGEIDELDVGAAQRGHLAPLPLLRRVDRVQAEPRREHAIERRRRTAPLNVPEDGGASLVAGPLLYLPFQPAGDPAQPDVAEGIGRRALGGRHAALRLRSLRDHDDRRVLALEAADDVVGDPIEVEFDLRDQDHVGPACEPRVKGDPASIPPHHLADQRPAVALRGRVEAVDRRHRDVDRGVEAEGVVGGREVVVDRLGNAHHVDAALEELRGGPQSVLAADRDQAVDSVVLQVLGDPLRTAILFERIGPRGAEDRPAARQDAADLGDAELPAVPLERSPPAVPVADELVAILLHSLPHDRSDHGVQPRAVAASGENAYPHAVNLPAGPGAVRGYGRVSQSMIGRASRSSAPVKTPPRKSTPQTGPGIPNVYAITITQPPRTVKRTTCTGRKPIRRGRRGLRGGSR